MLEKRRGLLYLDYTCGIYTSNYHNLSHVLYRFYISVKADFLRGDLAFLNEQAVAKFHVGPPSPSVLFSYLSNTPYFLLSENSISLAYFSLFTEWKKRIYSLNCYSLLHLQMLTRNAFGLTLLEWSPTVTTGLNCQTLPLPFLYCNGCHAWQFSERSLDYVQLLNLLPGNSAHWHLSRASFAPSEMLTAVSWGWRGDSATKGKHRNTLDGLLRKSPNVGELFLCSGLNLLKALQNFRFLMSIVHLDVSLQIDFSSC